MALNSGSETKVGASEGGFKIITGLAPLKILAVNPTKAELEKIQGRVIEKEPEYVSADEKGVKKLRVDFIVSTVIDEKFGCDQEIQTKVSFFLEDRPQLTSAGDKAFVLNLYGEDSVMPLENVKAGTTPDNMSWYNTTKMRPAYKGEIELVKFLKAYLNVPNRAFKDKVIPDITLAEFQFENIKKYFTGDIKEFVSIVNIRKATNIVGLVGGVKTQESTNKQYQDWFLAKPMKYAACSKLEYLQRDVAERKSQLAVDFGPASLRFAIFTNTPTVIEPQAAAVQDDPFGAPAGTTAEADSWLSN